jgi:hypothetical protein
MTLTVACVLRPSATYNPTWVYRLQAQVARHLSIPHRFVCLTNAALTGCEAIPLELDVAATTGRAGNGWTVHKGWWSKIELFRPGLLTGPTLYLDLDTLVIGSLDGIAGLPHRFTALADFNSGRFGSGMLAWSGDWSLIHEAFLADPERIMARYDDREPAASGRIGDQAFIEDVLADAGEDWESFQALCGADLIRSYKVHSCRRERPSGASVVCFHGKPKQHECGGWAQAEWEATEW